MAAIKFTASIIWKGKGCYLARADELAIAAEPATTQRGAIKNLKRALLARFRQAAEEGKLADLLDDSGYHGSMIYFRDINPTLECHVFNTASVSLNLPRNRSRRANRHRPNGKK